MLRFIRKLYCFVLAVNLIDHLSSISTTLYQSTNQSINQFQLVDAFSFPSFSTCLNNGDRIPHGSLSLRLPNQQSIDVFNQRNPVLIFIHSPFDAYSQLLWSNSNQLFESINHYAPIINMSIIFMSYGNSVTDEIIGNEAHIIDIYAIQTAYQSRSTNQSISQSIDPSVDVKFIGSHPLVDTEWFGSRFLTCSSVQSSPQLLISVWNYDALVDHVTLQEIPSGNRSIKSFSSVLANNKYKILYDLEKVSCDGTVKAIVNGSIVDRSSGKPFNQPFVILVEMDKCHWTVQHSYAISMGASGLLIYPPKQAVNQSINQLHCDVVCQLWTLSRSFERSVPVAMLSYDDGFMLFDGSLDKIGLSVSFAYQSIGPSAVLIDRQRHIHALKPVSKCSNRSIQQLIDSPFRQQREIEHQGAIDYHISHNQAVRWPLFNDVTLSINQHFLEVESALPSMREWLSLDHNSAELLIDVKCVSSCVCSGADAVLRIFVSDFELPLSEIARVHVLYDRLIDSPTGGLRVLVNVTSLMPIIACTRDVCDSAIQLRLTGATAQRLTVSASLLLTHQPNMLIRRDAKHRTSFVSVPLLTFPVTFPNMTIGHQSLSLPIKSVDMTGQVDVRSMDPSLATSLAFRLSHVRLLLLVSLHGAATRHSGVHEITIDGIHHSIPFRPSHDDVPNNQVILPYSFALLGDTLQHDNPLSVTYRLSFDDSIPPSMTSSFLLLTAVVSAEVWLPNAMKRPFSWARVMTRIRPFLLPLSAFALVLCICAFVLHSRCHKSSSQPARPSHNGRLYRPLSLSDDDDCVSDQFARSSPRSQSPRNQSSPRNRSPRNKSPLSFRRWPGAKHAFADVHVLSPVQEALSECSPIMHSAIPSDMPVNFLAALAAHSDDSAD